LLLLRLLEFSFIVLFLAVLLTQVVVPAIKGTRLFPLFDRRGRAAAEELSRAREEREIEALRRKAQDTGAANQSSGEEDNRV
jgi:hypothetical protein